MARGAADAGPAILLVEDNAAMPALIRSPVEPIGPVVPVVTSFEQAVKEFKLTPDQYQRSLRLREWARRNKNSKYIPEPLLQAWGFEIENTL